MSRFFILVIVLALLVSTLGCGFTVRLPVDKVVVGPVQTEEIHIAQPDASPVALSINFGAGELKISPGAEGELVSGVASYNVPSFKPTVRIDGGKVFLETGNLEIKGIPDFDSEIKNNWDLKLSPALMDLKINAGAYQGLFELGGLSLRTLEIADGAANVALKFSQPNKVAMDVLRYTSGASNVKLMGLANANFTAMIFRSGAGDYTLDFSGELKRDATVTIESGVSQVVIIVPKGFSARVMFKGRFSNVDALGDWKKSANQYVLEGSGPMITITVDMGAGKLELRNP